jgi:hypothetical protein
MNYKKFSDKLIFSWLKKQLCKERDESCAVYAYGLLFLIVYAVLIILVYVTK